jgi:hypothetical protein
LCSEAGSERDINAGCTLWIAEVFGKKEKEVGPATPADQWFFSGTWRSREKLKDLVGPQSTQVSG